MPHILYYSTQRLALVSLLTLSLSATASSGRWGILELPSSPSSNYERFKYQFISHNLTSLLDKALSNSRSLSSAKSKVESLKSENNLSDTIGVNAKLAHNLKLTSARLETSFNLNNEPVVFQVVNFTTLVYTLEYNTFVPHTRLIYTRSILDKIGHVGLVFHKKW
jgi:hypothetical protein